MTSQRQHVALRDSRCCWRDKEASSRCWTASWQLGRLWFSSWRRKFSDLRAPLPVIGRPCCRQILLYVFQMVETDDEAGEAPLIEGQDVDMDPLEEKNTLIKCSQFLTTKVQYSPCSIVVLCPQPFILLLAAAQLPPSISHRPTCWNILCIFPSYLNKILVRFSSISCSDIGAALAPNFVMQIRLGRLVFGGIRATWRKSFSHVPV